MARPIRAEFSAAAIAHNYARARAVAPASRVLAVVKADGYGHGLARVVRALPEADGFATLELEGAVRLRESGFGGEIVLLEGFFETAELEAMSARALATVVATPEQVEILARARLARPVDVFLKANTGMNRLGLAPGAARDALALLRASPSVGAVTLMTHFATADGPEGVAEAMRRFDTAFGGETGRRSLANSAAIFAHPATHHDVVRQGIALYGATPFADRDAASLGLRPAMTLRSRLIAVQDLAAGEVVGYGATWRADRPARIGIVACGYADGYPRHAPSGTPVLVDGVRVTTAGRVSMDMLAVDLARAPAARPGSEVVLWGEGLPVDEVAAAAGTVGYELLCAVAPRVPFVEAA